MFCCCSCSIIVWFYFIQSMIGERKTIQCEDSHQTILFNRTSKFLSFLSFLWRMKELCSKESRNCCLGLMLKRVHSAVCSQSWVPRMVWLKGRCKKFPLVRCGQFIWFTISSHPEQSGTWAAVPLRELVLCPQGAGKGWALRKIMSECFCERRTLKNKYTSLMDGGHIKVCLCVLLKTHPEFLWCC